jgi:hypothetical protein
MADAAYKTAKHAAGLIQSPLVVRDSAAQWTTAGRRHAVIWS